MFNRNLLPCFVICQTMDALKGADETVSEIAAAIGDKTRAGMLYCLMDGRSRAATELAVVAGVRLKGLWRRDFPLPLAATWTRHTRYSPPTAAFRTTKTGQGACDAIS